MRLLVTALALGTGCSSIFGLEAPVQRSDGGPVDVAVEPQDVGADACTSFSTLVNTCGLAFGPAVELSQFAITFNTDTKQLSGLGVPNNVPTLDVMGPAGPITFLVVEAGTITSLGTLRIVGTRAGGILSNSSLEIEGGVDVGQGGAAARGACGSTAGAALASGGAGGGGGGFWGAGGGGSDGDSGVSEGGTGGPAQTRPASPIGGCAGSPGGTGTNGAGAGGSAGGAVILIARTSITITGSIDANGQGGRGAPIDNGGGGGGGAGGMIALEAPSITIDGVLAANGGGGGEGAGGNAGADGADGPLSGQRALGGAGGAAAGANGGLGGAAGTLDGSTPTSDTGGGGGGGGGAGFVVVKGATPTITPKGVVSPGVTIVP